jgi:hypothetical protein
VSYITPGKPVILIERYTYILFSLIILSLIIIRKRFIGIIIENIAIYLLINFYKLIITKVFRYNI